VRGGVALVAGAILFLIARMLSSIAGRNT